MRDDHDQLLLRGLFEGVDEVGLGFGIERGSGFIEDQDARVLKESASDRDAFASDRPIVCWSPCPVSCGSRWEAPR